MLQYFKEKWAEGLCMIGVLVTVCLILSWVAPQKYTSSQSTLRELDGWYYLEEGQEVPVTLPASVPSQNRDTLVLYNDSLTPEDGGMTLSTRGAIYRLGVSLDEENLYQYQDDIFPRNDQMASKLDCDIILPAHMDNRHLSLTFTSQGDDFYEIPPVYIGTGSQIFFKHIADSAINLCIIFFMSILSVLVIAIAIYLNHIQMMDRRFLDIALFLLICGLWCATDSSIVQIITGLSPLTNYISFFAFMLLAVPMIHFVQHTGDMKKYQILDLCLYAFYANAIIQGLLNYFGIFDFIDMLFVTHLLLISSIMVVAHRLVKEYRIKPDKDISTILFSFSAVAAGGVIALIIYWILAIPFYELFFELGILAFIVHILSRIIISTVGNMRFRTEMQVYQRLAREDRLTGLPNRRAFDEYLDRFSETAHTCQNAVLIFLDINQLKQVNDTHGHGAGDELIIGAARVLEKAFGQQGSCFRIGGDEFCVILPDSSASSEECNGILDEEVRLFNQNSRNRLSIARGISFLRDSRGELITFSDWKYEADQQMYHNKGWYRQCETNKRK